MTGLQQVLRFFSLETLDARLVPGESRKKTVVSRSNPNSRWHTLEYRTYLVIVFVLVVLMYKGAMDASNETNPNYPKFEHLLSQGWMFGRKVDNSDRQYRFFRDNFWLIWVFVIGHTLARRAVLSVSGVSRISFDMVFGLLYAYVLHGSNCVRIAVHVLVMFAMARFIERPKVAKLALWTYGVATLFVNHEWKEMPLHVGFLDNGFQGIVARWDVFYNFSLLRILSYNLDYLERKHLVSDIKDVKPTQEKELDERDRLVVVLPTEDYSFGNYMAYLTYAPLFIAGPIITFNDFIYQTSYRQLDSTKDMRRLATYGARLLFCVLVMEFLLHFMYVVAVSKTKAWDGDSPFQLSMLGIFNLNIIWLKLLIPWRIFRFWSMLDGIDPPENMIRCMDNNYSAVSFWRSWHRSYNKWVLRYIYIPLGGAGGSGNKERIINSLIVFSFVAIWHDIELKLLLWGWLVVLFLMPEVVATAALRKYDKEPWFRHVCALGAVGNIWMMMIANLFGFCLGSAGTIALLKGIFLTPEGIRYFFIALTSLYSASHIMFEMREAEKRRGIDIRC